MDERTALDIAKSLKSIAASMAIIADSVHSPSTVKGPLSSGSLINALTRLTNATKQK